MTVIYIKIYFIFLFLILLLFLLNFRNIALRESDTDKIVEQWLSLLKLSTKIYVAGNGLTL